MFKGDISNEIPRRVLVTYDYVTKTRAVPKRVLGLVVGVKEVLDIDREALLSLLVAADRAGVRMELVVFGVDDERARDIFDDLDQRGWQPFNYVSAYPTAYDLASDLPYRPEVLGVIDIPERAAGYGSFHTHMDYLTRAI